MPPEMLESDRIVTSDWTDDGGILEYDISDLHPELGGLLQEYRINTTTYEGKRIYQSDFSLFGPDSVVPGSFGHLPEAVKGRLWEIIFAVKRKFFEEIKPEIVEHFISHEYSIEHRYQRYCQQLALPDYGVDVDKTKRTIVYQKKTTPAGKGGGRSL
jgi:hypothetical protein